MRTRKQYLQPSIKIRPVVIHTALMDTSGPTGGDGGGSTPNFIIGEGDPNTDAAPFGVSQRDLWAEEESIDEEQ